MSQGVLYAHGTDGPLTLFSTCTRVSDQTLAMQVALLGLGHLPLYPRPRSVLKILFRYTRTGEVGQWWPTRVVTVNIQRIDSEYATSTGINPLSPSTTLAISFPCMYMCVNTVSQDACGPVDVQIEQNRKPHSNPGDEANTYGNELWHA